MNATPVRDTLVPDDDAFAAPVSAVHVRSDLDELEKLRVENARLRDPAARWLAIEAKANAYRDAVFESSEAKRVFLYAPNNKTSEAFSNRVREAKAAEDGLCAAVFWAVVDAPKATR